MFYEIRRIFWKFDIYNDEKNNENTDENQTSEESISTEGTKEIIIWLIPVHTKA